MEKVQVKNKSKVKLGKKAFKSKRKHPPSSPPQEMDERFKAVLVDPRFKTMKKGERKIKIDSRFKGMFEENRFKFKSTVDKRGQPIVHEANEDLKSYYDISDQDEEEKEDKKAQAKPGAKKRIVPDARGQDSDELLSSSSDESSDEEENELDHNWGELDKDVVRNDNVSRRIAICNADWDRIKAVDLFVLVHSFKPESGTLETLKIYTSEFGKKRLAEETEKGPAEIAEAPSIEEDEDEDGLHHKEEDADAEYMTEQLRKYQLNRLKYYYAIAEFDSERTAAAIYDELDGLEYESSATTLDIRFVPDEMEFEDEPVQTCTCLPDLSSYKAPLFITTALQQSKVSLTWDETDPSRREKMDQAFRSKDEAVMRDLQAYLASSGEESSDDEDEDDETGQTDKCSSMDKVEKYRQLLASLDEDNQKEDDGEDAELEITFDDGGEGAEGDQKSDSEEEEEEEENEHEPHHEDAPDEDSEVDETVQAKKTTKSKKGKKRKVEEEMAQTAKGNSELSLLLMDEEGEDKHHFDYSNYVKDEKGKKKRKKFKKTDEKKKDDFEVDLEDPRFGKIYTSHLYNIDPSDPHFKKTDAMEKLLEKKIKSASSKRTDASSKETSGSGADSSIDPSLLGLVASVKASTKRLQAKKQVRN